MEKKKEQAHILEMALNHKFPNQKVKKEFNHLKEK